MKINKTSGNLSSSIKYSNSAPSYGLSCDADYCYLSDRGGYINKILIANNVTVENYPGITFVSETTTSAGNYSRNYIIANAIIPVLRTDTILISLYNSTGLVNSSSTTDPSVLSFYVNFSGLQDGIYYLNLIYKILV